MQISVVKVFNTFSFFYFSKDSYHFIVEFCMYYRYKLLVINIYCIHIFSSLAYFSISLTLFCSCDFFYFTFYFTIIIDSSHIAKKCTGRSLVPCTQFFPVVNNFLNYRTVLKSENDFGTTTELIHILPVLHVHMCTCALLCSFITCLESCNHNHN